MAPRLNHRKVCFCQHSVHGCARCKKRRVKCDEIKPSCSACTRHSVPCEYVKASPGHEHSPSSNNGGSKSSEALLHDAARTSSAGSRTGDSTPLSRSAYNATRIDTTTGSTSASLEFRLMHYFVMYTCTSFTTAEEMWRHRIPLVAYQDRSVLDGLLALSAAHLYREAVLAGDDLTVDLPRPQPTYKKVTIDYRAFLGGNTPLAMRKISRDYFQACVQKHRQALADRMNRDYEAAYISSVIISFYSLFTLGDDDHDHSSEDVDESLWFKLAIGPRQIAYEWRNSTAGIDVLRYWGQFDQNPDFSDEAEIFRPSYAEPWSALLLWATEYENITPEDQDTYEKTMAFTGLIYHGIVNRSEPPTATCRRIVALPARLPERFTDMVLRKQPRALVILAHVFGMMKAVEKDIIWFRGIPEKQIKLIYEKIPVGWRKAMQWPLKTLARPSDDGLILPRPLTMEQIAAG